MSIEEVIHPDNAHSPAPQGKFLFFEVKFLVKDVVRQVHKCRNYLGTAQKQKNDALQRRFPFPPARLPFHEEDTGFAGKTLKRQ
jgi:hypothetical protein